MLCVPSGNADVLKVACPLDNGTVLPRFEPSDLNCTLPVGVPPLELTVAVNMTVCPSGITVDDDVSSTVESAAVTTCEMMADVLIVKPPSPLSVPVMGCVPTDKVYVVRVVCPPASDGLASNVPLSKNETLPVGVPPLPLTVAVMVTDCPNVDGLGVEVSAVVVGVKPPVTWRIAADLD